MPGFTRAFIMASHAEEECPDLKSNDNAFPSHNMIYVDQEPNRRNSTDV